VKPGPKGKTIYKGNRLILYDNSEKRRYRLFFEQETNQKNPFAKLSLLKWLTDGKGQHTRKTENKNELNNS